MERVEGSSLLGRLVVSNKGRKLGEVSDLIFDTRSGEILHIVLKNPTEYAFKLGLEKTKDNELLIPFSAVLSIGDFIIIAEEEIV
jgi:sporulation protein YlmC with PRC-barrel domain